MRHTFGQMLDVADRLGDDRVNDRPLGADTNAVAALVIHCCGVTESGSGTSPSAVPRQRSRIEISSTATVAELHALVASTLAQVGRGSDRDRRGQDSTRPAGRQFLEGGDQSDGAIVLHVLEELYRHLGHVELAADAFKIRG